MNVGRTVFAQVMEHFPTYEFQKCVARYDGDFRRRSFSCWDQFLCLSFGQLTYRESLRDIEACLRSVQGKLYHMGFRGRISRATLADANESIDWRIYADFAQILIATARPMYATESLGFDLDGTVYALDSTTIDLCLSVFPWARFKTHTAAVKIHALLDLRGSIPTFIAVSRAKLPDVKILDEILPERGAFYVMDRGYLDLARLHTIHRGGAFFVIRTKIGVKMRRRYSRAVDKSTGLRSDHTVMFTSLASAKTYPDPIRRIRFFDQNQGRWFVFLTNNFALPALTITRLYKARWQVELFFKWIKQHLRIKKFYGTSQNAVKSQIWCAIATYVLIAIVKKELNIDSSLYTCLQILSVSVFEKTLISCALQHDQYKSNPLQSANQLILFGF